MNETLSVYLNLNMEEEDEALIEIRLPQSHWL